MQLAADATRASNCRGAPRRASARRQFYSAATFYCWAVNKGRIDASSSAACARAAAVKAEAASAVCHSCVCRDLITVRYGKAMSCRLVRWWRYSSLGHFLVHESREKRAFRYKGVLASSCPICAPKEKGISTHKSSSSWLTYPVFLILINLTYFCFRAQQNGTSGNRGTPVYFITNIITVIFLLFSVGSKMTQTYYFDL